jgi:hypothetical protein
MVTMLLAIALWARFAIDPTQTPYLPDMSALPGLWAALQSHAYLMAGAIGTNLLVTLAKQGWFSTWLANKLPSRYLPFVALVVGVLGTSSAELIAGAPWQRALLDGLMAAATAVFTHQAIVEGARNGKEIIPEKRVVPVIPPTLIPPGPPAGQA